MRGRLQSKDFKPLLKIPRNFEMVCNEGRNQHQNHNESSANFINIQKKKKRPFGLSIALCFVS